MHVIGHDTGSEKAIAVIFPAQDGFQYDVSRARRQRALFSRAKCDHVFCPGTFEMWKAPTVIAWLIHSRRCVRQAAGHRRLAACAPQSLRPRRIEERQRCIVFLARSGAKGDSHSQWPEPAAKNGVMLLG